MKSLKRLGVTVALTLVLGLSVFAGEMSSPPCAPPEPGEMQSPPCATAQLTPDDSTTPGQTSTPPNAAAEVSLAEVAVDVLQSVLMLF